MQAISARFNSIPSFRSQIEHNEEPEKVSEKKSNSLSALAGFAALATMGMATVSMSKKGQGTQILEEINSNANKVKPETVENTTDRMMEILGIGKYKNAKPADESAKTTSKPSFFKKHAEELKGLVDEFNRAFEEDIPSVRRKIKKIMKDSVCFKNQEFKEVNKVVTIDGKQVRIIFEGKTIDITSDGTMLQKQLVLKPNPSDEPDIEFQVLLKTVQGDIIHGTRRKKFFK